MKPLCARLTFAAALGLSNTAPVPTPAAEQTTTTIYVSRHFEVRDHDQPVKYVFHGETRLARITGSLSNRPLLQRLRLRPGWNLCSVALSGARFPALPEITAAYRWNTNAGQYALVGFEDDLEPGAVLWVKARTNALISLLGTYSPAAPKPVSLAGTFTSGPGLETLSLELPPGVTVWRFDSATQRWQARLGGDLAGVNELPPSLAPGEAIYVHAPEPFELPVPEAALRVAYYHPDHLGSSSVITDAAGELVQETAYYPFGATRHEHRPRSLQAHYGFTQKERDPETGLHSFEARYLASPLARFISPDPKFLHVDALTTEETSAFLRHPQKLNPYAYVMNRPLNYTDPSGLDASKAGSAQKQTPTTPSAKTPQRGATVAPGAAPPASPPSPKHEMILTLTEGGTTHQFKIEGFSPIEPAAQRGASSTGRDSHDVTISRKAEGSSVALSQSMARGTLFKEGTIIVRTQGPKSVEVMRVKLSELFVTSWIHNSEGGRPTESFTLNFKEATLVLPEPGPTPPPDPNQ